MAETIPSSGLQWAGASADMLDFMRHVYDAHVCWASRGRTFVNDLPASDLDTVEGHFQLRADAARDCRTMLAESRTELARQQGLGSPQALPVTAIRVNSGYRSASHQFSLWQQYFPNYFAKTQAARAGLDGGEFGDAAVDYMMRYVRARIGAPGFSLHNSGLAVDLGTNEAGRSLGADSRDIAHWRRSWLFAWLTTNAARFRFFQNKSIDEPWHWEYHAVANAAELFMPGYETWAETITTPAGEMQLHATPLLSRHRGTQPDLVLRWNDFHDAPDVIDIVVHLHGYSSSRDSMSLVNDKLPKSGLDFSDPDQTAGLTPGRRRPTLAILPRGNYFGGQRGDGYNFPALTGTGALQQLIDYAIVQFSARAGLSGIRRGRLILTAHSGGGAALLSILSLAENDPDEIQVFDALYTSRPDALVNWLNRHIQQDISSLQSGTTSNPQQYMREQGSALTVAYIPCFENRHTHTMQDSGTKAGSEIVHRAITAVLAATSQRTFLADYYRVIHTSVGHNNVPRQYGWRLLVDAAAALPGSTQLSGRQNIPSCIRRGEAAENVGDYSVIRLPLQEHCGFFGSGVVITEAALREAIRVETVGERGNWFDGAGHVRHENQNSQFGFLVSYWLARFGEILPTILSTLLTNAVSAGVNYGQLLNAGASTAAINTAIVRARTDLLAGVPAADITPALQSQIDQALRGARFSRLDDLTDGPWSAVFVVSCIRRAAIQQGLEAVVSGNHIGQDELLTSAQAHRTYVLEAYRRRFGPNRKRGTYHTFGISEREPQVGDIIIQDRQVSHINQVLRFDNIPTTLTGGYKLHADIVTETPVNQAYVIAIGGNLGNSARRRRYPLDGNRRLLTIREQLYTQEDDQGNLPNLPQVQGGSLPIVSTGRIFALLCPVEQCVVIPGQRVNGGVIT